MARAPKPDAGLDEPEFKELLAQAARSGNVPAMRLYHALYLSQTTEVADEHDPLAEADELARRRR